MSISITLRRPIAFGALYLAWSSSYLALGIAVNDVPPILLASLRFLLAAPLLFAYARLRGESLPSAAKDWLVILGSAVLLFIIASGLTAWAQQWVASNQAALVMAGTALWMPLLAAIRSKRDHISVGTLVAVLTGMAGLGLVMRAGAGPVAPAIAYGGLLIASIALAAGTLLLREFPTNCGAAMTAALQTMMAGAVLASAALLLEQHEDVRWTGSALCALAYLVTISSCIGYVAYFSLLREVTPAQLGTHAFVNPVLAILFSWILLDETLSESQSVGAALVVVAVITVMWPKGNIVKRKFQSESST